MRNVARVGSLLVTLSIVASAGVTRGTLLNDDEPYFIKGEDGSVYKAEWISGSTIFFEGDEVILTEGNGEAKLIDDSSDETADVTVEQVSGGSVRIVPVPVPRETLNPPAPSYPQLPVTPRLAAAPSVTTNPVSQTEENRNSKWPDQRMLSHPEHFIKTHVVHVKPPDTLALRAGPGTGYEPIKEIPADGTDIIAFDQDKVWDGDSWWCPVIWQGQRGYVGRSFVEIVR